MEYAHLREKDPQECTLPPLYVPVRDLSDTALQNSIKWASEDYDAAMRGERSPWLVHERLDEDDLKLALDLLYKELARRAEKIHK